MPPESIDLGDNPTGTAPTNEQITQIKSALGIDTDLTQAKARSNHTGTQSIATVSLLQDELDALNNNKVNTSDLSESGGAGKVPQYNGTGNLLLRPLRLLSDTGTLSKDEGNLILTDRQMVGWYASDSGDGNSPTGAGKMLFRIRQDNSHPYETNIDASGNICFYWGISTSNRALQFGDANGGSHYIYLHSGYASAGTTIRQSVPFAMNTMTWDGASSLLNRVAFQSTALDSSGTNSAFQLWQNVTLGSVQNLASSGGTMFFEACSAGVWSNGTAPAFTALSDEATITLTCSKYKTVQNASVTLGGNRTLAFSGALAGMRGVIYVKQDAAGSRTLTLPSGSVKASTFALSTTPYAYDRLSWEFDGTYYFWTIVNGLEVAMDADAQTFITAASISDATQKAAVNNLVIGLKNASLWTKFYGLYPFVGGDATAHSKDLKGTYHITWAGTPTHDANGVTGNASDAYGDTGINLSTLGALNSASGYAYVKSSSPTDSAYLYGATDAGGGRFGLSRNGGSMVAQGTNDTTASQSYTAGGDFRHHWANNRSSSTMKQIMADAVLSEEAVASTAAPNRNIYVLCRNSAGTAAGFTNANLGFFAVGQSLSSSEWTTFRSLIDSYQTALGRKNP